MSELTNFEKKIMQTLLKFSKTKECKDITDAFESRHSDDDDDDGSIYNTYSLEQLYDEMPEYAQHAFSVMCAQDVIVNKSGPLEALKLIRPKMIKWLKEKEEENRETRRRIIAGEFNTWF